MPDTPPNLLPFDAEQYLDLMAPACGIAIRPEWRAGVLAHINMGKRMADTLFACEVDDDSLELANVFKP